MLWIMVRVAVAGAMWWWYVGHCCCFLVIDVVVLFNGLGDSEVEILWNLEDGMLVVGKTGMMTHGGTHLMFLLCS